MNLLCRFSHLACMTYETSWGSKHFMTKASNSPSKQQTLHLVKGLITNDFYHLFFVLPEALRSFSLKFYVLDVRTLTNFFFFFQPIPRHYVALKKPGKTLEGPLRDGGADYWHKYGLPSLVSLWQKLWPICMHITP